MATVLIESFENCPRKMKEHFKSTKTSCVQSLIWNVELDPELVDDPLFRVALRLSYTIARASARESHAMSMLPPSE